MSLWQIYTSITEEITQKATLFKNKEIKPLEFNEKMLLNVACLLNYVQKIQECQEEASTETGNSTSSNDLKEKIIFDFYLPVSHVSLELESQLQNKGNKINPEVSTEKNLEIKFEENPIVANTFLFSSQNNIKSCEASIFDNDDDLLFDDLKRDNELRKASALTDESLDVQNDFDLFEKKIETSCLYYSSFEESNSTIKPRKEGTVASYYSFQNNSANPSRMNTIGFRGSDEIIVRDKTSFGKTQSKIPLKRIIERKKELNEYVKLEFEPFLPEKTIFFYSNEMNTNYLRYMLVHFQKIKDKSKEIYLCEDKMFLNLMKIFILEMGISDKKIYEDILRSIANKKNECDFDSFLACFLKLLKLKKENSIIKYKFLLYVTRMNNEKEFSVLHIKKFFDLISCKKVYDEEICEEIIENLINRYNSIYGGDNLKFPFDRMMLVLEMIVGTK